MSSLLKGDDILSFLIESHLQNINAVLTLANQGGL